MLKEDKGLGQWEGTSYIDFLCQIHDETTSLIYPSVSPPSTAGREGGRGGGKDGERGRGRGREGEREREREGERERERLTVNRTSY